MPDPQVQPPAPAPGLDDAIDALLSQIDAACDRFEHPEPDEDAQALADLERAAKAVGKNKPAEESAPDAPEPEDAVAATEEAMERVENSANDLLEQAADDLMGAIGAEPTKPAAEPETAEPEPADGAAAEPEAAVEAEDVAPEVTASVEAPAEAAPEADAAEDAEAESAIDAAVDDLLGEAAEELAEDAAPATNAEDAPAEDVETVTAEAPIAEPEADLTTDETAAATEAEAVAEPEASVEADDAAEAPASDEGGPEAAAEIADEAETAAEPEAAAPVAEAAVEAVSEAEAAGDDASEVLNPATFDAMIDGVFESPEGEAVDTTGVDTSPDPSLLLDKNAGEATTPAEEAGEAEAEPEGEPTEAVAAPTAPEPKSKAASKPAPAPAKPKAEKKPTPEPAAAPKAVPAKGARAKLGAAGAFGTRVLVWAKPKAQLVGGVALKLGGPVGARVLVLMSKPLEKQPPKVRDSVGWVAIWTLFLALCVWGTVMLRKPQEKAGDGNATQMVAAEGDEAAPATANAKP